MGHSLVVLSKNSKYYFTKSANNRMRIKPKKEIVGGKSEEGDVGD